jgi:hypothetical protein
MLFGEPPAKTNVSNAGFACSSQRISGNLVPPDEFMKRILLSMTVVGLLLGTRAPAQDAPKGEAPSATAPEPPKKSQEELEATFKATLTKATLTGRWCLVQDGKLTPEKEDKYTITAVNKIGGDMWLIHARIQYGKKDVTAPVPVQVKWAGDTPVIVVDKIPIPGSGTYSARLLIYEKTYAGTWSGGDHRGLMNGLITNEKE